MRYVKNQKLRGMNVKRRQFLSMVGKSGISAGLLKASPLLMGMMTTRFAEAQGAANKRFILTYMGNGSPPGHWLPKSATEMAAATTPFLNGSTGAEGYNVANYVHFHECTVNGSSAGHGKPFTTMMRSGQGPNNVINTLDTQIAKTNFFGTPLDIIRIEGDRPGDGSLSIENGQQTSYLRGAQQAFNEIFNGVSVSGDDSTYKKVFEMNARAISSIQNKLGNYEKERLDSHLGTLQKLETRLTDAAESAKNQEACGPTDNEYFSTAPLPTRDPNMLYDFMASADIIVSALECGITNVASFCIGDGQGEYAAPVDVFEALAIEGAGSNDYHSFGHSPVSAFDRGRMMAVHQQINAYIISELAKRTAAGESSPLIDSTLLLQTNGMGNNQHGAEGSPWLMASGNKDWGLGEFKATSGGSGFDFMKDIPERMGLNGAAEGEIPA